MSANLRPIPLCDMAGGQTTSHGKAAGGIEPSVLVDADSAKAEQPRHQPRLEARADLYAVKRRAACFLRLSDTRSARAEAEIRDDSGTVLATARAELRILPRDR